MLDRSSVVAIRPLALLGVMAGCPTALAQLAVTTTTPGLNAINVSRAAPLVVNFDRAVNPATFAGTNFRVFGRQHGPIAGALVFSNANQRVTFTPSVEYFAGEVVTLMLSHNLRAADGTFLRAAGYKVMFTAVASPSTGTFRLAQTIDGHLPGGGQTRIYGGQVCDLNRDGFVDLTSVNEVSADLRVFLNQGVGNGQFAPMIDPGTDIPFESSPNEIADFDNDGFIDLVTSSNAENKIAVAFGNGNGTFRTPVLEIAVPAYPRGFGVHDADADGDFDICVACADGNVIAYLANNGSGTFAAPVSFDAGVNGEYGMQAVDMNNDGILDLVVGGTNSQTAGVVLGNGNGTFTFASARPLGGSNWVIACNDLNNDGNIDVSTSNAGSGTGSVLLGNGNGTLQAMQIQSTGAHNVSTDLGDLEGDGDMDWIISSFGGGRWFFYKNNGAGAFSASFQIQASNNPSCAMPCDVDNDGDLDITLYDEIADLIRVMLNVCPADMDNGLGTGVPDGGVDINDLIYFLQLFELGDVGADIDDDGVSPPNPDGGVDINDLIFFLTSFEAGC